MDVLAFLAGQAGAVVSVEQLIAAVWKEWSSGDGSVYLAIRQLRRALEESADGVPLHRDHSQERLPAGRAGRARRDLPRTGTGSGSAAVSRPTPRPIARNSRRWAAAAVGGVRAARLRCRFISRRRRAASFGDEVRRRSAIRQSVLRSAAGVFRRRCDRGNPQHAVRRTRSARDRTRVVIPVQGSKRRPAHHRRVVLDVEHVLEGSVRKAGDRVRISAQLSRCPRQPTALVRDL